VKGDTGDQGLQGPQGEIGPAGADGENGVSPTVAITAIDGGHSVTVTDTEGSKTFDVMDGLQGEKGDKGDTGPQGPQGVQGADGNTPFIGSNGNWWIGDTDTGIAATGPQGPQGEKGETGESGVTPTITAVAGANINSVGTPTVTATTDGNTVNLEFNYLKGAQGSSASITANWIQYFRSKDNGITPFNSSYCYGKGGSIFGPNKCTSLSGSSNLAYDIAYIPDNTIVGIHIYGNVIAQFNKDYTPTISNPFIYITVLRYNTAGSSNIIFYDQTNTTVSNIINTDLSNAISAMANYNGKTNFNIATIPIIVSVGKISSPTATMKAAAIVNIGINSAYSASDTYADMQIQIVPFESVTIPASTDIYLCFPYWDSSYPNWNT
jgi:hypothetical protein